LALILGQQEAFEDVIIVRDMKSGTQETIPISKMVEAIKKRLK
jgi:histidyl-tRNA synthetase